MSSYALSNAASPMELPALDERTARMLMQEPFGDELTKLVINHMSFFVFGVARDDGAEKIYNATCFFVKSPKKLMVVTAGHVIRAYQELKRVDGRSKCQIGNLQFDPAARLCQIGEKTDIAILDITAVELSKIGKAPITLWPPHPPDNDDCGILLAGYPAAGIVRSGVRSRGFGIYAASTMAQRVTERQLSCMIEWDNVMPSPSLGGLPPRNYDVGGMSGGPVLTIRERNGLLTFPIGGVISEGRGEEDKIVAERGDNITADGYVRG